LENKNLKIKYNIKRTSRNEALYVWQRKLKIMNKGNKTKNSEEESENKI